MRPCEDSAIGGIASGLAMLWRTLHEIDSIQAMTHEPMTTEQQQAVRLKAVLSVMDFLREETALLIVSLNDNDEVPPGDIFNLYEVELADVSLNN